MEFAIRVGHNGYLPRKYWGQIIPLDDEAKNKLASEPAAIKYTWWQTMERTSLSEISQTWKERTLAYSAIKDVFFYIHWDMKGTVTKIIWTFKPEWEIGEGEEIKEP